ncbi:MAG: rod shape-determining protein MreC [Acidobacteriota bacterium]
MSDRWSRIVVAALLVAHLVLLSRQPATAGSPVESWLLGLLGPVARAGSATVEGADQFAGSLRSAGQLREENTRLREQVETMRQTLVRLQGVEEELQRLSRLTTYTPATSGLNFVADVVFADTRAGLRTLVIHTGGSQARVNQTVVTDQGLVGRVVAASGRYAKVLPVTDPVSSVSAMIRRTRRQGLVHGAGIDPRGDGSRLLLDNVPRRSDVRVGDVVLSAGLDGVYPRGLKIGVVDHVESSPEALGDLFLHIELAPAVDFGLLDQVYVMAQGPLPDPIRDDLLGAEDGTR